MTVRDYTIRGVRLSTLERLLESPYYHVLLGAYAGLALYMLKVKKQP